MISPLTLLSMLLSFQTSFASLIGIGLNGKDINVQEVWQDGRRIFLIEKLEPPGIEIKITLMKSGEASRKIPPVILSIPAIRMSQFDASSMKEEKCDSFCFFSFQKSAGGNIGLMEYRPPPKSVKGISVWNGLNGFGGQDNDEWIEQEQLSYRSGSTFEVTLKLKNGSGIYTLATKGAGDLKHKKLKLLSATSKTLKITKEEWELVIDSNNALAKSEVHSVTLRLQAPVLTTSQFSIIEGTHCSGVTPYKCDSRHQLSRAIFISAVHSELKILN